MRSLLVVGARPNFVKAAAIVPAMLAADLPVTLVHTGQHYDYELSQVFFEELALPAPQFHLGVGSGTQAEQTAGVMIALEKLLTETPTDVVLVVGDTNSALGAALAAAKAAVPIIHIEAGLRSYDRSMSEEYNRVLVDAMADWWFTPSRDAQDYLSRKGLPGGRVHMVGNVMIDTLLTFLPQARGRQVAARLGLSAGTYGVVTIHRPSNTDSVEFLHHLTTSLSDIAAQQLPLVLPVHPRLKAALEGANLWAAWSKIDRLHVTASLSYLDFIGLLADARLAITDSGGIQEETTVLGLPCLTMRDNTERPITIEEGTNRLVGSDARRLSGAVKGVLAEARPGSRRCPEGWDGQAATRLATILRTEVQPWLASDHRLLS